MSTKAEQAALVQEDEGNRHGERVRVVLEYRKNGHKIIQTLEQWHEIKTGEDRDGVELVALQHAIDKRRNE